MKKILILLSSLFFLSSNWSLPAHSSNRTNLIDTDFVKLETLASKRVRVANVSVHQEDDILEIAGEVHRRSIGASGRGHMDIAILDSEGTAVRHMSTHYIPRLISPRRFHSRHARFNVHIPLIVSKGSKIVVAFHKKQTERANTFKCGDNMALKKW